MPGDAVRVLLDMPSAIGLVDRPVLIAIGAVVVPRGEDISDAELETLDEQLDAGDYDVTSAEAEAFSQDELAYEGEMDVVDQYEFEDPGVGDWDTGVEDMGFEDMGFDDMGGFDDFGGGGFDDFGGGDFGGDFDF